MRKFRVVVNGSEYNVEIEELGGAVVAASAPAARPVAPAAPATPAAAKPAAPPKQAAAVSGAITAPMPGTVLSVAVSVGATVTKGQTLLILEAMKMENEIQAPGDGVVEACNVSQGQSVNAGDTLIVLS